jgi:hypothetical protein
MNPSSAARQVRAASETARTLLSMAETYFTCETCGEAIEATDEVVTMARQVDVTAMSPSGQRQYADGLRSMFHPMCAPASQLGVWRSVSD